MIHGPAIDLIGIPGPTGIGIDPATLAVRAPIARDITRGPAVAVIANFLPIPVSLKMAVKKSSETASRASTGDRIEVKRLAAAKNDKVLFMAGER